MTYEEWCQGSKDILAQAEKYNQFAEGAQYALLTNIAPRIAKLGRKGYYGCGFHYDMEQRLGKLVIALSIPWQPCANHLDKVKDDMISTMINKILYQGLLKQVREAETGIRSPKPNKA